MTTIDRLTAALTDRYTIERQLGEGGMATVYLAHDVKHDRKVALKVLKPELAAVIGADRFVQEIKVTANLQHPNILALYDSGEADAFLYYVMPYVEGETLRDKLSRERQLAVGDAVRIAEGIAAALDYAHRRDVIHRDIKPENILLHDGQPLVADFGIALAISAAGGARLTETGLSIGTPHYMSPEQASADRELDGRTDVYSLGATLYEMLVGEPPFTAPSAQAVVAKILTEDPSPVTTARSSVPPHVAATIQRALAKLPADRFATASEFSHAMNDTSLSLPSAHVPATRSAAAQPWKLASAALGIVALGAVAFSLWVLSRPLPPTPTVRYALSFSGSERQEQGGGAFGTSVALSPDGARLAYVGLSETGFQLWLRERDQLDGRALAGTEGGYQPFFSPDGRKLGFIVPSTREIKTISLGGEPPVTIVDGGIFRLGGDWGRDGYVYFSRQPDGGLSRVLATGGSPERLSTPDSSRGELRHAWPQVLAGGNGVLFTVEYTPNDVSARDDVAVLDLNTGETRILARGVVGRYAATGHLVFVRFDGALMAAPFDQRKLEITGPAVPLLSGMPVGRGPDIALSLSGRLVYAQAGTSSEWELVWVDRGGQIEPVDSGWQFTPSDNTGPRFSPDGRQLAISVQNEGISDVWIKTLPDGPLSRLTFEGQITRPAWSPDGRSILYLRNQGGSELNVWQKRADGSSAADLLLDLDDQLADGLWSPDGKWLVVRLNVPGADILGLRPGTDSVPVPLVAEQFDELAPALSPDGRWLAYVSNESGRTEVFVRPFPNTGDAKWQISTDEGREPAWAHNGRELFYKNRSRQLIAVTYTTTPTFGTVERRALFTLPPGDPYLAPRTMYDITVDDERFIMFRRAGVSDGPEAGGFVVVENFFEELRAKTR